MYFSQEQRERLVASHDPFNPRQDPPASGKDQPPLELVECGCCGSFHPATFTGDCRDDGNRFAGEEDVAERLGGRKVIIEYLDGYRE